MTPPINSLSDELTVFDEFDSASKMSAAMAAMADDTVAETVYALIGEVRVSLNRRLFREAHYQISGLRHARRLPMAPKIPHGLRPNHLRRLHEQASQVVLLVI